MKLVFCFLALLPFVLSAPLTAEEEELFNKRFLFHISAKDVGQKILDLLGSDTSEAACEAVCPTALSSIPGASLLSGAICSPACHWVQTQVG